MPVDKLWEWVSAQWIFLTVTVAAIGLFMVWFVIDRMQKFELEKRLLDDTRLTLIRTINHHRHDWMNDLQVLFGYIQLNKQEKLQAYIEQMTEKMHRDGLVAKLGYPFLIAYLLSYRAETRQLELEVRPEKEIQLVQWGEQGLAAAESIVGVLEAYKSAAVAGEGDANSLVVTLDVYDRILFVGFEYNGSYDEERLKENLQHTINRLHMHRNMEVTFDFQEREADMEMRVHLEEMTG